MSLSSMKFPPPIDHGQKGSESLQWKTETEEEKEHDYTVHDLSNLQFSSFPFQSGRTLPTISEHDLTRPYKHLVLRSITPPKLPPKPAEGYEKQSSKY